MRLLPALAASMLSGAFALVHADTIQNFDGGGTAFTLGGNATAPVAGGPFGSFARLTPLTGNQTGRIGFTLADPGIAYTQIVGSFDFRMIPSVEGSNQADGMGFVFIPTSLQGTSGDYSFLNAAETAQITGGFGIGLNIHQAATEISNNTVKLAFNGVELTEVAAPFDLSTSEYHRAQFAINFLQGGGANVSLTLTQNVSSIAGVPQVVFTDFNVPGFDPYEYRVGVQARTGGQFADQQIDNISVANVPEPGTGALALLGIAGIASRRRRS